jgi:streptomycin 6-kinase
MDALPEQIEALSQGWRLEPGPALPGLSYHYVCEACLEDGQPAVLKLGPPTVSLAREIAALAAWEGRGMARLLAHDAAAGALLLERLQPGGTLRGRIGSDGAGDEGATDIAVELMQDLWRPVPAGVDFPSVGDLAEGLGQLRDRYDGGTGPLPQAMVARAEGLFAELLASSGPTILLHGDLHHLNILESGPGAWRAIDPQGLLGEPACELAAFLRNPWDGLLDWPAAGRILARRVDQFAEGLALERARILGWGFALAILSAWWSVEDGTEDAWHSLAVAELLAGVPGCP